MHLLLRCSVISVALLVCNANAHDIRGVARQLEQLSQPDREKVLAAAMDRAALFKELQDKPENRGLETVFRRSASWKPGTNITVCFMDGSSFGRRNVAKVAREWTKYGNLSFDFGHDDQRSCLDKSAAIRVTFITDGYWSFIGTDARLISKNLATLGLSGLDKYDSINSDFTFYVLHEFGHALGLEHEHQSPNMTCDIDLNAVKQAYGWSDEEAKTNILRIQQSRSYLVSAYDPKSIMHYTLPASFFSGNSSCITSQPSGLSAQDKLGIATAYPDELRLSEEPSPSQAPAPSPASSRSSSAVERVKARIRQTLSQDDGG